MGPAPKGIRYPEFQVSYIAYGTAQRQLDTRTWSAGRASAVRISSNRYVRAGALYTVLANLRTGLDLRTNTSTHFTWSSPRFIPVVLISGLVFAKTRSPSLALKRLSYVITWDTTCIYQQFNLISSNFQFLSFFLYVVDISNLYV